MATMKKKRAPEFDYAAAFDSAMYDQFGEPFQTEWNIFAGPFGGWVTTRVNGKNPTKEMLLFGEGLSEGIAIGRAASTP